MTTGDKTQWVCHTCKTVYVINIPAAIKSQPNGLPPAEDLMRITLRNMDLIFDKWGFGRTLKEAFPHMREYMVWYQKHKGHRIRIFTRTTPVPPNYTIEERYSQKDINSVL